MTDHHHDRSEDLLDALRDALRLTDPVPPEVVSAAKESFTWRTIDAELAALSYDSVLTGELTGTRGHVDARTLSFEFGALTVEFEVEAEVPGSADDASGRCRLVGQVAPRVPDSIEVHHVEAREAKVANPDQFGRFTFESVERGPVRLLMRFAPPDGPAMLLTEWVTI